MCADTASSYQDIDLHIKEIKYLFLDPELDPFKERRLQTSGVEEAASFLKAKERTIGKIRLNIFIPRDKIEPYLQNKTADALSRYCDFKILQNMRQLEIERAAGFRSLIIGGLIFLIIVLLVLSVVYFLGPLSENILSLLDNFFTVLIWIAIWNAAEIFLYGFHPYELEIKAYRALKNAEVVIIEET